MIEFDLKSVYIGFLLSILTAFFIMFALWFQTRGKLKGVNFFVLSTILFFTGHLFIFLRNQIPDFISIIISNFLIILGTISIYIGINKFNSFKDTYLKIIILLGVFTFIHYYFYALYPNIIIREVNYSLALSITSGFIAWQTIVKSKHLNELTLTLYGIINIFIILNSFLRIFILIVDPYKNHDFLKPQSLELVSLFLYFCLTLLSFFSLIFLISRRLINEISDQDEKFIKAFHFAPYSMSITRMSDGKILDVNEYFEKMQGVTAEEVIGKTIYDLNVWNSVKDRVSFLQSLKEGRTQSLPYNFRKKKNETFPGEISGQIFHLKNEECLITAIVDISEKKKAEQLVKKSQEMLKNFATQLQIAVEDEKVVLANQIDNQLNQNLVALKMDIGLLKEKLKNSDTSTRQTELSKKIEEVYSVIGVSLGYSLELMNSLRNEVLHLVGFMDAIDLFIKEFTLKNKIKCSLETNLSKLTLDSKQSIPLFRVFENAMENVVMHSRATEVILRFNAIDSKLKIEIIDNGVGFEYKDSMLLSSKGLMFIQERIHLLDGNLQVISAPGCGTKILIDIPISKESYQTT